MKKDGKYRFSLQFGSETEAEQIAGEFLERLGNKKSTIVVAAINEYLASHPQLQNKDYVIKIERTNCNRRILEKLVLEILDQRETQHMFDQGNRQSISIEGVCNDIQEMLSEVALFEIN